MARADEDLELDQDEADVAERPLVDPRTLPVRFSRLKQFSRSALHYLHACQSEDKDTFARKLGRGAHAMVLGTPVAVWTKLTKAGKSSPRTGAEWLAFQAEHPGAEILNSKEHREAKAIADAIRNHPIAAPMLYKASTLDEAIRSHPSAAPFLSEEASQLELELDWTYLERACQSHLDVYRRGAFVADVKTATDGNPEWFPWAARRGHYFAQLACYMEAVESLGHPTPSPYVILVESAAPNPVTVLKVTDRAIEAGRKQVRLWFEDLKRCEASNSWQGYSQCVEELDLPPTREDLFEEAA